MKINGFCATKEGCTVITRRLVEMRQLSEKVKCGKRNENGTLHSIGQSDD